jgi:trimethylamine--corrinoid protein Co-methyltransferase
MARISRKGRRRVAIERKSTGLDQIPWSQAHSPYAGFEIADADAMQAIHETSISILKEAGIRVMSNQVMDLFERAGALVDRDTQTVCIDETHVAAALGTVPKTFDMVARTPSKKIQMGGSAMNFGLVAGPPNTHDCIRGRRAGNYEDYCDFIRLAQHFNAVNIIGNQVVAPVELAANTRHLDTYLANIRYSDLVFHVSGIGRGRVLDGINMMAISRAITVEDMRDVPGVITVISVNSPRLLDDAMSDGLIAMAQHFQPVSITPFTLMGAMTPQRWPNKMPKPCFVLCCHNWSNLVRL